MRTITYISKAGDYEIAKKIIVTQNNCESEIWFVATLGELCAPTYAVATFTVRPRVADANIVQPKLKTA